METRTKRIETAITRNAAALIADRALHSETKTVADVVADIVASGQYIEVGVGLSMDETGLYQTQVTPEIIAQAQHFYDTNFVGADLD